MTKNTNHFTVLIFSEWKPDLHFLKSFHIFLSSSDVIKILVADVFLKIFRIFIKFCRWHCRPCQTSMMMFFVCVNYFQRELCIDVWLGSKYASTLPSIINIFWVNCCMRIDKAENSKQCNHRWSRPRYYQFLYSFLPYLVTLCNKQTLKVIQLLNIWRATSLYRNELEICLLYL